jgi:GAF domain-containing protein
LRIVVNPPQGSDMQRRGGTRRPLKGRRTGRAKAHKSPNARASNADLQERVVALTRELKEAREQQASTADVLKVISRSTFDLQTVLDTLVESAARLCGAEMANIWRPKDGAYRLTASYGVTARYKEYLENKEFLTSISIEPGRGTMVGRVLLEKKTFHVSDIQADPEYELSDLVTLGGYRTLLGVPLLRQGDPIGVLVLIQSIVRPFTDKQIELATTFADQAVIAIENTRLLNELRESLEQQTVSADVLKTISRSTFDLQVVLDALTESVAQLCGADMATIARHKGDAYHYATVYKFPPDLEEYLKSIPFTPGRGSVIGRTLLEGKVIHLHDVLADPEYTMGEVQKRAGFRTSIGVPLMREGVPIGVINLLRGAVRPFTEKQIDLLKIFATRARRGYAGGEFNG